MSRKRVFDVPWSQPSRSVRARSVPALPRKKPASKIAVFKKNRYGRYADKICRCPTSVLPPYLINRMTYVFKNLDSTAGGFSYQVMRGNSIYDPDFTGVGSTARGYASLQYCYNYYKVISSAIKVTIVNLDSDDPVSVFVTPELFSTAFGIANKDADMGRTNAASALIDNQSKGIITNRMSTRKILNCRGYLDDPGYGAGYAANPTHAWFWHVVYWNRSLNALNIEVTIEMEYKVLHYGEYVME